MAAVALKQERISTHRQYRKQSRSLVRQPHISPEEYLAQERQAQYKSEYFDGEIVAMAGASKEHNLIVSNRVFPT